MKPLSSNMLPLRFIILAGCLSAIAAAHAADRIVLPDTWVIAENGNGQAAPAPAAEGQPGTMSIQDIVRKIEQEHDASVIEIELDRAAAQPAYRIKLLDVAGRESRIRADADTGETLSRAGNDSTAPQQGTTGARIPMTEMITRFEQEYDGRVLEIELEREDTHDEYEIKILAADGGVWKLDVDAHSGTVLKQKQDGRVPTGSIESVMDGLISMPEIIARMESEYGGEVVEIELDRKTTHDEYDIELIDAQGQKWEIEVDARSGDILKRKQD